MGTIYKILNDLNDKVYIGKTKRDLSIRWSEHKSDYKDSNVSHRPLYLAMLKYGVEHFSIEKIEECDENRMDEREKYWIKKYDSYENGYNATLGGDGGVGRPHRSKELEQNIISEYLKNKSCSKTAKCFGLSRWTISDVLSKNNIPLFTIPTKRVGMYDKNTNELLKIFPSAKTAGKETGYSDANIGKCCKGQRKTAYGYVWKYLEV